MLHQQHPCTIREVIMPKTSNPHSFQNHTPCLTSHPELNQIRHAITKTFQLHIFARPTERSNTQNIYRPVTNLRKILPQPVNLQLQQQTHRSNASYYTQTKKRYRWLTEIKQRHRNLLHTDTRLATQRSASSLTIDLKKRSSTYCLSQIQINFDVHFDTSSITLSIRSIATKIPRIECQKQNS